MFLLLKETIRNRKGIYLAQIVQDWGNFVIFLNLIGILFVLKSCPSSKTGHVAQKWSLNGAYSKMFLLPAEN